MKVVNNFLTGLVCLVSAGLAQAAGTIGTPEEEAAIAAYDGGWMDQAVSTPRHVALEDTGRIVLAEAHGGEEGGEGAVDESPLSPECAAFQKDRFADVGDVLRAGCEPTLAQMSALMDNPLGNVAMLFTQLDFAEKKAPQFQETDTMQTYMGIFQFPKKLGENWNLINRVIWTVPSLPIDKAAADFDFSTIPDAGLTPPPPGGIAPINQFPGRTTGFGDLYYLGLFAPAKTTPMREGKFAWGLGFGIGAPTASEDLTGTGKWSAGPSGLAVYMGPKWNIGGLVTHYESFAGSSNRADVSLTNAQYFVFYNLSPTFSIGASPNIIGNHEQGSGDKWTVPIGIGFVATVNVGKVPVRFGTEIHYSVVRPDDVLRTEWNLRWYVIPAAPSALFKWMN